MAFGDFKNRIGVGTVFESNKGGFEVFLLKTEEESLAEVLEVHGEKS